LFLSGGWTCGEPPSPYLEVRRPACAMAQAKHMACCIVHLHSSGQELNLGLKSFNYYPSPRPFTPHCGETCRPTLPIGTLTVAIHIYNTRLDSCSCQETCTHECVHHSPTPSINVLAQCLALSGYGKNGPISGLRLQG